MDFRCIAPLLALGVLACDGEEERRFGEYRYYVHEIFETPEECEAAQPPDLFFNCSQTVEFFPDGGVVLMVTDIQNNGSYEIVGDEVRLSFDRGASEVGRSWTFTLHSDLSLIDRFDNEWRLEARGDAACLEQHGAERCR